jgi:serine/threonine-protein kinase
MDLKGRLLGNRYEVIEKIGNGGMATVYKAKCHVLNRYVAIKILKDEFTTDEEFIKDYLTSYNYTDPKFQEIFKACNKEG